MAKSMADVAQSARNGHGPASQRVGLGADGVRRKRKLYSGCNV